MLKNIQCFEVNSKTNNVIFLNIKKKQEFSDILDINLLQFFLIVLEFEVLRVLAKILNIVYFTILYTFKNIFQ